MFRSHEILLTCFQIIKSQRKLLLLFMVLRHLSQLGQKERGHSKGLSLSVEYLAVLHSSNIQWISMTLEYLKENVAAAYEQ